MNGKLKSILKISAIALIAVLSFLIIIKLFPYVRALANEENRAEFESKIRSLGFAGLIIMFLLQIAQVLFAVIPGEPVEVIMGALYGTWGGLIVCLLGCLVGSLIIFLCVLKFGNRFVSKFSSSKSFSKFKFLHDPTKRDFLVFLLFLIPGTPKDALTYFAPFTGIPIFRFLLITSLARIPAVISSTYVGSSLIEGDFLKSLAVYIVVGVVSGISLWLYNLWMKNKDGSSDADCDK